MTLRQLTPLALAVMTGISSGEPGSPLSPVATVPLPRVAGRIDHLAFDPASHRLFVAALGNDTVEVVDTATDAHVRSLAGFHEPQGIAVVPDLGAVAVANGGSGTLQLLDATTLQTRWTVQVGGDADNVRYDATAKRLFVAVDGGIAVVDPPSGLTLGRIGISGHPESFQLAMQSPRVFANVPGGGQVVAGDRSSLQVTARWPTTAQANYPMALDEAGGRLFIGCRRPALLAMLGTDDGRTVGSIQIVGDTDDLFYDRDRQRLYVIGGEGFIDVIRRSGDALQRVDRVPTRAGARTGLWVAALSRLYLAVPARGNQSAEIRVLAGPN